jgi:hypothetical protein
MQPYAFPYLGYFQLMAAVDAFVLLDDVTWINQGWINRNRLAGRDGVVPFVFPVTGRRAGIPIDRVELFRGVYHREKFLRTLRTLYGGAPYFRETMELACECLACHQGRIADSISHMLSRLTAHLRIGCRTMRSSAHFPNATGRGVARVLAICNALGATRYINAEGGRELYRDADFAQAGVELRFLHHLPRPYRNLAPAFIPRLSILDVLMFNSAATVRDMLGDCRIVSQGEAVQ